MAETTPMMAQYLRIKEQHRDAVLFFRLGDFYEMFNEDAIEVSRLLNLTLTHRAGSPMCGIPYHAAKIYIARLLRAGKKIAICEQLSIPGPGKGLADRKVIEVITPGTATEDDYLDSTSNNYLAALYVSNARNTFYCAFAYIDVTTGEFAATSFANSPLNIKERFRKELGNVQPKEILLPQSVQSSCPEILSVLDEYPSLVKNFYPDWSFNAESSYKRLCTLFGTGNLQAFALSPDSPEIIPAGLLLEYLEQTTSSSITHVSDIRVYTESQFVSLDDSTRKNLELVRNLSDSGTSYTLFATLNQTCTAMGTRLLQNWILHPLVNRADIEERVTRVDTLYRAQKVLTEVRSYLSEILDIERLAGRVAMERAHGKDILALKQSLSGFMKLYETVTDGIFSFDDLTASDLDTVRNLISMIDSAIAEDCPVQLNEGGLIRAGWSTQLDELRGLRDNSNSVLESYLAEEREQTGIQNLKIRYNRMIGYFLEVSKGNLDAVPAHFIRRRSLANGERYTTERLMELERELASVHANIITCEQELFFDVRSRIAERVKLLVVIARKVAEIDVIQSFASAATRNVWVRPEFVDTGLMEITDGRHPVVETHLPTGEFIPNSITLSSADDPEIASFALVTGPNMAGKSTFLRQIALIHVMAQAGSFVPAYAAKLTPVDKIFCRVGASDNLARGESTFLVEMTETAYILRAATKDSLVIMDEVGRGTSTEDGLSIAQAVTEYLLTRIGAKTLFATHYHQLARLKHPRLASYCLDVLESEGTVVFLKKVRPGASANSYGIHVAKLAGVPEQVIQRARQILASLDLSSASPAVSVPIQVPEPVVHNSPQLFSDEELVLEEILSVDTDSMTPLEALKRIDTWKRQLFPAK